MKRLSRKHDRKSTVVYQGDFAARVQLTASDAAALRKRGYRQRGWRLLPASQEASR